MLPVQAVAAPPVGSIIIPKNFCESMLFIWSFYEFTGSLPLSCCHSGAFMLSTMLICRTCRRMAKHTTKVNSIVNATASR